ncbi:hypothetical protein J4482_02885 [Candidatus Woesearchaeota archaeon]|nr:hypothetical protein [Candidatus Woesearchaeota archaeon]
MKQRLLSVFVLVILLQITAVFAAPVVNSFTTKFVYPNHIQIEWDVSSTFDMRTLELYKDSELLYYLPLTGTQSTSMYQTPNDNKTHTFKIVVYDTTNASVEFSEKTEVDDEAPEIISPDNAITNKNEFVFETNEPAYCIAGFKSSSMTPVSKNYEINHTVKLNFTEGTNNILVKCIDKMENEMGSSVSMRFILDITKPGKVSSINLSKEENKLIWTAATDANGIASYNIGNINGKIASVNTNSWTVTVNDSVFYVSAVDKAGNEGEKEEYNYRRALLLSSDFVPEKESAPVKTIVEKKSLKIPDVTVSRAAWIAFGVLAVIFAFWKIYEHKTDKHGLRRYLRERKKMRDRH